MRIRVSTGILQSYFNDLTFRLRNDSSAIQLLIQKQKKKDRSKKPSIEYYLRLYKNKVITYLCSQLEYYYCLFDLKNNCVAHLKALRF